MFGGKLLILNLDKLVKEGWLFENLYVMGMCFVCGIEVIIIGFLLILVCVVVKFMKS